MRTDRNIGTGTDTATAIDTGLVTGTGIHVHSIYTHYMHFTLDTHSTAYTH
jgi:hypothetical protein